MLGVLVAAALAGCTGGSDNGGQLPTDLDGSGTGTTTGSGDTSTPAPGGDGQNATFDAFLEASATNGTAPLNVTLTFGASANGPGEQENMTWSLTVWLRDANETGNGTGGNATGNGTGNSTGNTTGNSTGTGTSTGTSTGSATATSTSSPTQGGNGTGNETGGNETGTGGNGAAGGGNATGTDGNGTMDNGTLLHAFNGTGAELPGNRSVWLNQSGEVFVEFTVRSGNDTVVQRNATIAVVELPPGSPLGNETQVFEGSVTVSDPVVCFGGSNEHVWVLNSTFADTPAEVSHLNVTLDSGGFALEDFEMTLTAPNGTEVASGSEINAEGPFEAGNYTLEVTNCAAAEADYTATAVAHYVTVARESDS